MKELVRVAAVQLDVAWLDPKANVERMLALGEEAVQAGPVDVLIYPELSNVGYVTERDPAFGPQYMELAESIPGPTTEVLGGFARQHGVGVVVGLGEMHPVVRPSVYNTAVLIGPSGEVVGKHRKVHLPAEEKHYFYRGRSLDVWDTELGRVGLAICYDALFPETLRVLALRGAEILFCPFNIPREHMPPDVLTHLARTRALENLAFVIACNRVGEQPGLHFFGESAIADPGGALLALGDDKESILYATLRREWLPTQKAHGHPSNIRVYQEGGCLGPDVQLLGCAFVSPEEIETVRATQTAVILDPTASMYLGMGMPPTTQLLSAGVPVALGTNGVACNGSQDMFESMKNAAGLAKIAERNGAAVTQQRVLELATIEGARALGLDARIGSIEPGKRGDLIIVDLTGPYAAPVLNVVAALVSSCKGRDVRHVLVDGRVVVRDGKLVTGDESAVLGRAILAARRCAEKAGLTERLAGAWQ